MDSSFDTPLLVHRHGRVLVLTFNRPDRLNAWNEELESAYYGALADAEVDSAVRAIVVTGAGRGFCAGADLDYLQAAVTAQSAGPDGVARAYPVSIRKPMIAAINGAAVGLGLVQALYCDVRFATPAAKISTAFSRRGLIAEYGSSWLLAEIIGRSRALDLLMSGRTISGTDALAFGLVHELHEPDVLLRRAIAYAEEIAENCSPAAVAVIKSQVNAAGDLATALRSSERLQGESFQRPDVAEGIASFLQKRQPAFPDLRSLDAVADDGLHFLRTRRAT